MFSYNPYPKSKQVAKQRIKPTQRQMGDISPKVRKEVKQRSNDKCEVMARCNGTAAVHMAHIIGRKQLTHVTTAADILHACLSCHIWLDQTADGIAYRKSLREQGA